MRTSLIVVFIILVSLTLVSWRVTAETVEFKDGSITKLIVEKWTQNGIVIIADNNNKKFYFYAEIENINGESIENMNIDKKVGNLSSIFIDDMKQSVTYGKLGQVMTESMRVCKNFTGNKTIKLYNKAGKLKIEKECTQKQIKTIKRYYDNGLVRVVLDFRNGEISRVVRFSKMGKRISPSEI